MKYVLAFDIGTGGVKATVYDENLKNLASSFVEYETEYLAGNFHLQNPHDWWKSIKISTQKLNITNEISAIALSSHSLGVVPLDQSGNLLVEKTPIWSDGRATAEAESFFKKTSYEEWYYRTGNGFPPHLYSIFKIKWYKNNMPQIYNKTFKFLGVKDYINYLLSGVFATDHSYASGCGAYDLLKNDYCNEYIEMIDIEKDKFPQIFKSTHVLGKIKSTVANELGISKNAQIICGGVDNSCMSLGAGCVSNGDSYGSLGSSAWVATSTDKPILNFEKKPYVWAHCVDGMYVPSVGVFSSGSSLKWVKNQFFSDLSYQQFDELASQSVVGANNLIFNPSLAGGSSIDVSPNLKGGFAFLDLCHTRCDIARATLEGIALDLKNAYDVLSENAKLKKSLLLVGGGAKSKIWCQIYADVFGVDVELPNATQDAASLGAACVALVGSGAWNSFEKISLAHENKLILKHENHEKYYKVQKKFNEVKSAMGGLSL